MVHDSKCSKKDKRLLVLLALGALILLRDLDFSFSPENGPGSMTSRFESVPAGSLVRIKNNTTFFPGQDEMNSFPVLSPRLAIFLGLPFAINQAGYGDLLLLSGIGPYLAGNIIDYRQKHGPFSGVEELEFVPGIGPKLATRIATSVVFN